MKAEKRRKASQNSPDSDTKTVYQLPFHRPMKLEWKSLQME
jgi:hypothetical protein